ncbi:MAG: hypothetical protein L0271_20530 [Gemmatimonadetes bacterium]|nr:hypothetical protein [Gemmatimonadota bacterium]
MRAQRWRARRGGVRALAACAPALIAGCELTEITLASVEDAVIAEVVLVAGPGPQHALLHRTRGASSEARVPGATVEVRNAAGRTMRFVETGLSECVDPEASFVPGSCYIAFPGEGFAVLPGATYDLRVVLPDGGIMTGTTKLPGDFTVTAPAVAACAIPADTTLELSWTSSADTWATIAETSLAGIRSALADRGVVLENDPLRLFGLAISRSDTTIAFPGEFGLFDRAESDIADALLAIRRGLPPGVTATIIIAASERNYVNWARGGQFNPSGLIRVPSIRGAGTGVFAGIVAKELTISTVPGAALPDCLQ